VVDFQTVASAAQTSPVEPLENLDAVNLTMRRLIRVECIHEEKVGARDREILAIQVRYHAAIEKAATEIAVYRAQIEQYCRTHPETMEEGKKSVRLHFGLMGLRDSPAPPLVPISPKWTAERIREKIIELFGKVKYFHKPKPPAVDLVKLKTLSDDQLKEIGLKRDLTASFYLDLNRSADAAEQAVEVETAA
jgi:Bacteriophage Mu Gam like protein